MGQYSKADTIKTSIINIPLIVANTAAELSLIFGPAAAAGFYAYNRYSDAADFTTYSAIALFASIGFCFGRLLASGIERALGSITKQSDVLIPYANRDAMLENPVTTLLTLTTSAAAGFMCLEYFS